MPARWRTWCVVLVGCGACAQFRPPSAPEAGERDECGHAALIEDGEDGDDQTLVRGGRGGYLYTYADERGSTVAPAGEFTMGRGGANGSTYALRMNGTLARGADAFAGVGFGFSEPKRPYDASRYTGIAFYARRAAGSLSFVRLKLPDAGTDPDGGVCTDCYNDFGIGFQVTEEWTRYVVRFADLKQEGGWGTPRPAALEPTRLYGVQWQVTSATGADYDVWIDDISFIGCPG